MFDHRKKPYVWFIKALKRVNIILVKCGLIDDNQSIPLHNDFLFQHFWRVSSVLFPFYFPFNSHFNLVNAIIALVPKTVDVEWQLKMLALQLLCLFVSRVRLMECLLPDKRVHICSITYGHDTPLQTPLGGHTFIGC